MRNCFSIIFCILIKNGTLEALGNICFKVLKIVKMFRGLSLLKGIFPDELEIADLSLILENNEDLKENYRPVNI